MRVTAAVALAFRLGDRLPDTGLQALADARGHADEITEDAFPVPWDRSLLGFAALALHRIGLSCSSNEMNSGQTPPCWPGLRIRVRGRPAPVSEQVNLGTQPAL